MYLREGPQVWAPRARTVDLVLEGRVVRAMSERGDGWFVSPDGPLPGGTDYRFALDGGEPLPDPRSPYQPAGVFGPSRVVDHGAFAWTDERWRGFHLPSAVLYELHVGTFTEAGTFDGIIERLDHLVALGVDAIEVMPVAAFDGRRGWGYDGVALFAVHEPYGGPDGFKRLVDAAHDRGLGVVLDVVYNHLGPVGNVLPTFGPYLTDRYQTPWGDAMNLDGPQGTEVRRFLADNAMHWFTNYHVDALRLDAVQALVDDSATHFLEELSVEIEALAAHLRRPLWLIAEDDRNDPRLVQARSAGGYGLDAVWNDDFHHALHALLTGERDGYYADFGSMADVAKALRDGFVLDGQWSYFRERVHGRPIGDLSGHRFVVSAQNHDQIGNRAKGDRLSHLVGSDRLRAAAALVLCSPYVPLLFQGEEWGASARFPYFADFGDVSLVEAVRRGRRAEFAAFDWVDDVPDPFAEETFNSSVLDWSELERTPHRELLDWHRWLLRLRRSRAELTDGRRDRMTVDVGDDWLELRRGDVSLQVDLSGAEAKVTLLDETGGALRPSVRRESRE